MGIVSDKSKQLLLGSYGKKMYLGHNSAIFCFRTKFQNLQQNFVSITPRGRCFDLSKTIPIPYADAPLLVQKCKYLRVPLFYSSGST